MEARAVEALRYIRSVKKHRIEEHREVNSSLLKYEGGLTDREYNGVRVSQKKVFGRSKKFTCNRLWNHNRVPTSEGFNSLKLSY